MSTLIFSRKLARIWVNNEKRCKLRLNKSNKKIIDLKTALIAKNMMIH